MAKYDTTITKKDGSKVAGYIEDGKSYYNDGTSISAGDSVVDAQGKTWTKGGDTSSNASSEVAMINNAIRANNAGIKKAIDTEKARRQSTYTAGDNIDALASLQKQMKQQELQRARANALSSLNAEQIATNQAYANEINKTNTNADIALKNYFENVANRGQTYSGSTSQGEIAHNIARQNNISALQQAQASALADIARRKQLAEQGYIDDMQSASNAIDLKVLENRIANEQADKEARAKAEQYEAEQALNRAKLMAEMGDFSGLKGLNIDTTGLEKKWALDMANTQSLINSRNNNGGTGGGSGSGTPVISKNYSDVFDKTKEYLTYDYDSGKQTYEGNMNAAKYAIGEFDIGNISKAELINIIRQSNISIETVARTLKKSFGANDTEISDFVIDCFGGKISDNYLSKILDYAKGK